MGFKKQLVLFIAIICSQTCVADFVITSRYSTANTDPLKEQINPLLAVAEFKFPAQIQTVGNALNFVLHPTGYALIDEQKQSDYVQLTLKKPLPVTLRNLGPIKIINALEVLMGKNVFQLVEDPLYRVVDFKLKKEFANKTGVNNELRKSKVNKG